ncbi:hypothetical protein G5B00_07935 [Parapedobacter sp. SGR-10]|uniref:hypothetical protein n=1 Tax=Parapedobacter sp. SGR-10 TaxID=2710879 RepID=UPI0013CFC593|nr:hypothetical protein [Parapedobacter sp. SGR-10]NGF56445.1 hypothetical protein [Parapedobacter sp. SGR-10]
MTTCKITSIKVAFTSILYLLFFLCHIDGVSAQKRPVELIEDTSFQGGLMLTPLDPKTVQQGGGFAKTYRDTLAFFKPAPRPVWRLSQWHSRYSLEDTKPEYRGDGSIFYADKTKKVGLSPEGVLWLEVNASEAYTAPRVKSEHWPHLLVTQMFEKRPPVVGELKQLLFSMEIKLEKCENKMEEGTFDRNLHTAHTPLFFMIRNNNRKSEDYGQKIWFGIPSFDYRHVELRDREHLGGLDRGTKSYMYDIPPREFWGNVNLHDKQWHRGQTDLVPHIMRVLELLKEKGIFLNSSLHDLIIDRVGIGWEVPGTFDAAFQIRNLSLKRVNN